MPNKSFSIKTNQKIKPFKKTITVDSDKSLSIRSFLIGSICQNISKAENILESEDVFSTIECLQKLGVKIKKLKPKEYLIFGKGVGSLFAKKNLKLDFGNSGTASRLLISILSTTPNIEVIVTGDQSLKKRSMKKLITLMEEFGAEFLPKNKFNFPLKLVSTEMPVGIECEVDVSAQLKSAVIFAGLNSFGNTSIIENKRSRDHTENMLKKNTNSIKIKEGKKRIIKVFGKRELNPFKIKVPGDPSSAAFFTALTLLNKKSSIKIKNVGLNPTRIGFFEILKRQKAKIKFNNLKIANNEKSGDIIVNSCKLKPIKTPSHMYSRMVDEYPILFVIAALIKGVSVFKNISELASKESNRITEMQKVLRQIGIKSVYSKNELKIFGKGLINASNKRINVPNLGDHRICMSSFILALLTGAKIKIKNFETVFTSSPSFLKIMKTLGAKFEIQK